MKRKFFTIILSILLLLSQAVPALAENLDDVEGEDEKIEVGSAWIDAVGDLTSDATDISIGTPCSGSITDSNTEDFYRFKLSSSGEITLTATALISKVNYRLYDNTGVEQQYQL